MKNLGLVFFPAFDWLISPGHPEREERLLYTRDQLVEEGIFDLPCIKEYRPRLAEICDLQRAHIGVPNIGKLITPAHLTSAGGCLVAADAVMKGETKKAFALVRPPGHHAMRVVHGIRGFCTINIEAIMVEYLRSAYGVKRIAVIDTDVHHGDGSEDVFYHDPNTLYISFHQDGRTLYPGTGFVEEAGTPGAWGTNINLPLLPSTGDEGLHRLYDNLIARILDEFKPDIIVNSAGQDNHFSDPLASMNVTAQGYASLNKKINADIAVLEGGYSVEGALPYVNTGIILAMAGLDYSQVLEPDRSDLRHQDKRCNERVDELVTQVGRLWDERDITREKLLKACGNTFSRKKNIYYDEEGIREQQIETIHYCNDCEGYMSIKTDATNTRFGSQNAYIIVLHRGICPKCRQVAYDKALQAKKGRQAQYVLVQDIETGIIEEL